MKELKITSNELLKIDIMGLPENYVIVVSDSKAKFSALPEYAKTKIIKHQGKVNACVGTREKNFEENC